MWSPLLDPQGRQLAAAHLLLFDSLLLVRRRLLVLISVLFGTTINELLGKVLGLGSVPQVGPDVVVHLVRRVHFFQEGCERGHWESSRGGVFEPAFQNHPMANRGCCTLFEAYHPGCWLC